MEKWEAIGGKRDGGEDRKTPHTMAVCLLDNPAKGKLIELFIFQVQL